MNDIVLSCIIPVHNQKEDYLRECIESVLAAKSNKIELVVINSESTNNSEQVIDSYTDNRIVKYNKKDEGVVKNYQFGINNSRGDYVIFIDSDDYIDSKLIDDLLEVINEKEYDLINYGFYFFDKNKKWPHYTRIDLKSNQIYINKDLDLLIDNLTDNNAYLFYARWCNCYKTRLLREKIKNSSNVRQYEDTSLNFMYLRDIKSLFIMKENYYYNRLSKSSTTQTEKINVENLVENYKIQKSNLINYFEYNYSSNLLNLYIFKIDTLILCNYIYAENYERAKSILNKNYFKSFKKYYVHEHKKIKYILLKFRLLRIYRRFSFKNKKAIEENKF